MLAPLKLYFPPCVTADGENVSLLREPRTKESFLPLWTGQGWRSRARIGVLGTESVGKSIFRVSLLTPYKEALAESPK